MPNDVSAFGFRLRLVASKTFPAGIDITQFTDDADPFDFPSQQIADTSMGVNGDLITWSKANPLKTTVNVIPDSDDDKNLSVLLEANRPGRGKLPAGDIITLTALYPNGSTKTATSGVITDGTPGTAVAGSGRRKSKSYAFAFENLASS